MATLKIEGEALKWLLWMDEESNMTTWSDFMEDVLKRFGQNEFLVPVGWLNKLVHTTSVKEYQRRFESMDTKVHRMTKEVMKVVYITRLNPMI